MALPFPFEGWFEALAGGVFDVLCVATSGIGVLVVTVIGRVSGEGVERTLRFFSEGGHV